MKADDTSDRRLQIQYSFEEFCAKTLYNIADHSEGFNSAYLPPFDDDVPMYVVPAKAKADAAKASPARTEPSHDAGMSANAAPPAESAITTKEARAKKEAKPKKMSCLDAAAKVLADAGSALTTSEMIDAMATAKLRSSPSGQTPAATLYSAILREINTKGAEARFTKTERGKFAAK